MIDAMNGSIDIEYNINWNFGGYEDGYEGGVVPELPVLPMPEIVPSPKFEVPGEYDYFIFDYEERNKWKKHYRRGKYRTVVIVYEGKVVEAPYDENGPQYDESKTLTDGDRTWREGEVQ